MGSKIIWSPRAASNLEELWKYISKDSSLYASLFIKKINSLVKTVPQFPEAGRVVPEFGNPTLREKIFNNYRVVYRIKGEMIEIVTISHSSKPLSNIQ